MSTVQAGDVIAVYRGGQLYHAPADMSTVQDTDLIVVGRGNVPYKCTVADWRASQGKPPAIYDVLLADSPQAGRFTSGTFASTVDMAEEGVPPATKGIKGWVEGSLKEAIVSPAITAVNTSTVPTSEIFATTLYTGTANAQKITTGIDLLGEGGLLWCKSRATAGAHVLVDTARGPTKNLFSNGPGQEDPTARIASFQNDGFTFGSDNIAPNESSTTNVAWTFRKAAGFFDVLTYTGNGGTQSISHNLGSTPGFIIVKSTSSSGNWLCFHRSIGTSGYILLNSPNAQGGTNGSHPWNNTAPTDTTFTVGYNSSVSPEYQTNMLGVNYVAYLFAHDPAGASQCGDHSHASGTTWEDITLGWEPQFLILKCTTASRSWWMLDNKRGVVTGGSDAILYADLTNAESPDDFVEFTPTGFRYLVGALGTNQSIVYIAIRKDGSVSGGNELTFGSNTGLSRFAAGDAVTEVLAAGGAGDAAGSVKSVDAANNKMTVNTSAGTWDVGNTVKGPMKTVMITPTSDEIVAVNVVTGPTYSATLTSAGAITTPGNAFDGDLSSTSAVSTAGPGSTLTWAFAPYGLTGTLEAVSWGGGGDPSKYSLDGGAYTLVPDTGVPLQRFTVSTSIENHTSISIQRSGGTGQVLLYGFILNGKTLIDAVSSTQLTFATDKDLTEFTAGTAVNQDSPVTPTSDEIVAVSTTTSPTFSDSANLSITGTGYWNIPGGSFDGNPDTFATSGANILDGQQSAMKFTYPGGPVAATKLEVMHGFISSYVAGSLTYSVNGGAFKSLTGADKAWIDVTADAGGTFSDITLKYVGQPSRSNSLIWFSQIRLNGQVLIDNASHTTLTFSTDKDLTGFTAGAAVNQSDSAASGTVGSVDVAAKTMTLATSTGTWGPANTGKTVVGPSVTGSGTVDSTDPAAKTMTLATSTGTWTPNAGKTAVGPTKPAASVKLFCTLDASLNVTDLQSPDPGFTAVTGAGPYTITFPATLPSGNPPDTDLPAGTTLTTEVQASNSAGTSDKQSTPITPA